MRARLRFENKLMGFLEGRGYQCIRSAGSRGPVDVFAFNNLHCRAIQLKTTKSMERHGNASIFRRAIMELRMLQNPPNLIRELWVKPLGRNWRYLVIDDLPESEDELKVALKNPAWIEA